MNALVTGGAGFIGSHLVDRLLEDGHYVVVMDNFVSGHLTNLPTYNKKLVVVHGDITDPRTKSLYKGIDVVFHLAALTRPQQSIIEPEKYHRVNVDGTLRVLRNAKEENVSRVVFASSASIYGDQEVYPTPETALPHPMSPYAEQKLIGENYCKMFCDLRDVETTCLRLFNVYGTKMSLGEYGAVIPRFINYVKSDKVPVIYGSGDQSRDFVHVDDVVDAFLKATKHEALGEIFNIGYGESYSINGILTIICKNIGVDVWATHEEPVVEPWRTIADIDKAERLLDWKPTIDIQEGIKRLVNGT